MAGGNVRRGDHASKLAAGAGFRDVRSVWGDDANAGIRAARNPNVLADGDEVVIPTHEVRVEEATTASRHTFVVRRSSLRLRTRVEDACGPVAAELTVESQPPVMFPDGQVDVAIGPMVEHVALSAAGAPLSLWIGGLEPNDMRSGPIARLHNLGYLGVDRDDGPTDYALRSALEEFQCDEDLAVTGHLDAATLSKLVTVHGS